MPGRGKHAPLSVPAGGQVPLSCLRFAFLRIPMGRAGSAAYPSSRAQSQLTSRALGLPLAPSGAHCENPSAARQTQHLQTNCVPARWPREGWSHSTNSSLPWARPPGRPSLRPRGRGVAAGMCGKPTSAAPGGQERKALQTPTLPAGSTLSPDSR